MINRMHILLWSALLFAGLTPVTAQPVLDDYRVYHDTISASPCRIAVTSRIDGKYTIRYSLMHNTRDYRLEKEDVEMVLNEDYFISLDKHAKLLFITPVDSSHVRQLQGGIDRLTMLEDLVGAGVYEVETLVSNTTQRVYRITPSNPAIRSFVITFDHGLITRMVMEYFSEGRIQIIESELTYDFTTPLPSEAFSLNRYITQTETGFIPLPAYSDYALKFNQP